MSKIPQGEWNAIAARYAKGESISRIAQSYSCTPPAIHYILKRNKQRTAQTVRPLNGRLESPSIFARENEASRSAHGESKEASRETSELGIGGDRGLAAMRPAQVDRNLAGVPQQHLSNLSGVGRASALTPGLDRELHGRAEAAIEAFRSSFDAALLEGSPEVRDRLRQAASDLMRVAARTTIVLDRLNAAAERTSMRPQHHLLSATPREHT
jgi:hypothetical protein